MVDSVPQDPRKTEAEIRKLLAEADKAEADARKALVDSYVPTIPTELPQGTVTAPSEPSPIGAIAAYRALEGVAGCIAEKIDAIKPDLVWITPANPLPNAKIAYEQILDRTTRLEAALDSAIKVLSSPATSAEDLFPCGDDSYLAWTLGDGGGTEVPARRMHAAPGLEVVEKEDVARAAPGVVGAALQLTFSALPLVMSLFETKTTVLNDSLTVGFVPPAAVLASRLSASGRTVMVSGVSSPGSPETAGRIKRLADKRDTVSTLLAKYRGARAADPPAVAAELERLATLKSVVDAALKAERGVTPDVLATVRQTMPGISCAAKNVAAFREARAKDQAVVDSVVDLLKSVDNVLLPVTTIDGASAVQATSLYEQLTSAANGLILVVDVSYAGRRSAYHDKLGPRDEEVHTGWLVVSWFLLNRDGTIVASSVTTAERAATTKVGSPEVHWPVDGPR